MSALVPPNIPDYRLLSCIGRGSYGEVWLARGVTGLHRAVKIVHRAGFSDDRPYEREFSGIKKFQAICYAQENLINILHVGRNDEAGYFFYVMELADPAGAGPAGPTRAPGSDLDAGRYQSATLKHLLRSRGRLPVSECITIAKGLAHAMEHLHANGLIHRDIKPSNVIFVNGVPKLADIGLVAGLDESRSFVGTEGFVPPEGPGTVGADVFALGRLLYEMSTGRDRLDYPKLPENFDELEDRGALIEFNEIVLKAGDPERTRRYESAAELVRELLLLEAGKSVRRLRLLETRFALALRTAAVAVTITVLAVAAWLWTSFQAREARKNFADAQRHRLEAEAALRDVLLNQVRANRQSGWSGQRRESLRILRENPAMTNSLAFRNEAIACLSLPDIKPRRSFPVVRSARLAFNHHLTQYATNDRAGSIYVRSIDDDRLVHYLPGLGVGLYRMGFSENDEKIGASYLDRRFIAWDLGRFPAPPAGSALPAWTNLAANARPPRILLPAGSTSGMGLPDGSALAVLDQSARLHFLDPTNGVEFRLLTLDPPLNSIRFNGNGQKFACGRSNQCFIYRTSNGDKLFTLTHPSIVGSFAWHPDGRRLATASYDFKVRIWDTITGQQISVFEDHEAEAVSVEFDATGTLLASAAWDGTTRLWSPESGRPLVRVRGSGNGLRLAADGTRLAYSTWNGTAVEIMDIVPGRELISFERFSGIYNVTFSPDSRLFVAGSAVGLHVWQWPYFHPVATLPVLDCGSPSFSVDGQRLYSSGRSVAVEWPFDVSGQSQSLAIGPAQEMAPVTRHQLTHFHVSPDGKSAALAFDKRVRFFSRTPQGWHLTETIDGSPVWMDFSPDNKWIAIGRKLRNLDITDATGKTVTNFPCANAAWSRFSPDGRWFVAVTDEGYQPLRVGTWEPGPVCPKKMDLPQHECLAFAKNGSIAAMRTGDRDLSLVSPKTWETLGVLAVPLTTVAVNVSPDGNFVAVATEKMGIQVWDIGLIRNGLAAMDLDWAEALPRRHSDVGIPPMLSPAVTVDPRRETNEFPSIVARIPPRPKGAPREWIDLGLFYNAPLPGGWMPPQDSDLDDTSLPIPLGTNRWGGINFDVRGVIQLGGPALAARGGKFPEQVSAIPIERPCQKIHLLLGTDRKVRPGTMLGGFAVRYITGEEEIVPVFYGRDLYDWTHDPLADIDTEHKPADAKPIVAWEGTSEASRRRNITLRVYRTTWENKLWDVPIQSIDLFSRGTGSSPFILGMTVE